MHVGSADFGAECFPGVDHDARDWDVGCSLNLEAEALIGGGETVMRVPSYLVGYLVRDLKRS